MQSSHPQQTTPRFPIFLLAVHWSMVRYSRGIVDAKHISRIEATTGVRLEFNSFSDLQSGTVDHPEQV